MEVRLASVAAPGRPVNEDHAFAYGDLVGVLDGVTEDPGLDSGCRHGPAWYVRRLATRLGQAHDAMPTASLAQLLAVAIDGLRRDHGDGCDLTCPRTPASTVCLLRVDGEHVEYLVLGDSPLVLDCGGRGVEVIADERFAHTIARLREAALVPDGSQSVGVGALVPQHTPGKYRYINQSGGYWIAAANPQAAFEAVTGTLPLRGPARVRRAALLTDGASRAVEHFRLTDWPGLLDLLTVHGPAELIRQVRRAEIADDTRIQSRHKRHDDATAALCLFEEE
ncbi:hypothetical protein [Planosporangium mesophilum]|uniref:Protein phosphatase 2C domain-containing protein n=1 Tax=Planosporangium mesophilum TaxID=689768 RepID=A0A8J3TQ61_9ACTN|nr:hypothetical protein [Planosporangium mesophilum]NJC83684.1 hypothetical protein [Planosporangium mesophilum]GII25350.1 hypothetical protein Pme01_49470 [Planosporangium mesophilum]